MSAPCRVYRAPRSLVVQLRRGLPFQARTFRHRAVPLRLGGRAVAPFLLAFSLAAAMSGCSAVSSAPHDASVIRPWAMIGSVRVGASADAVRRTYGPPLASQALRVRGGTVIKEWYYVEGGTVVVLYEGGVVAAIQTQNPRYRTPEGVFVGRIVERGTCRRDETGDCLYLWRSGGQSFRFDERKGAWVLESEILGVEIGMDTNLTRHRRGKIEVIRLGDPKLLPVLAADDTR